MSKSNPYFLDYGKHITPTGPTGGRCAMEWVAYLAGEKHSDAPVCVSPVLRRFCIVLNDRLPADERQKLRPYLARTIGTAGDGMDDERVAILREWLIHERLPKILDLAGCEEAAARLRALPSSLTLEAFEREMVRARDEANGARSRARARLLAKWPAAAAAAAAYAAAYAAAAAAAAAADAAYAAAADAAYAAADAAAAAAAAAADAAYAAAAYAAAAAAYAAAAYAAAAASPSEIKAAVDARLAPFVAESRAAGFELLERLLPKEIVQLPVVADAAAVCDLPEKAFAGR